VLDSHVLRRDREETQVAQLRVVTHNRCAHNLQFAQTEPNEVIVGERGDARVLNA
jgi:hypothetical protein